MKRFQFPLEKLRNWRETQFEIEEGKLERLIFERTLIGQERQTLDSSEREERRQLARGAVSASDLTALAAYLRYCEGARRQIAQRETQAEKAVAAQRQVMIEARRRVEMLNDLKDKRKQEWRKEMDAKEEEMVAELVVSRWRRTH